jgi:hypothetical protein
VPPAFITNDADVPIGVKVGVRDQKRSQGGKQAESSGKSVHIKVNHRATTESSDKKEKSSSREKNASDKHQASGNEQFVKVASGSLTEGTGNVIVIRRGGETGNDRSSSNRRSQHDDIHLTATDNAVNEAIKMVGLQIAGGQNSHVVVHRSKELNVCYTRKEKWTKADRKNYLDKWRKFRNEKKGGCCGCCGKSKRQSQKVQHSDYDSD